MSEDTKKTVERISGRTWAKEHGLEEAYDQASGPDQLEFEAGLRAERDREAVTKRRDKAQWLVGEANQELESLGRRTAKKESILKKLNERQRQIDALTT